MEAVLEFEFPLPPLPEQRRIVGILDEAFDAIATAKANTEKNLQNARAIFESHMEDVLNRRGDGWFDHCLGDLAVSISTGPFGTMLHKSDYVPEGIPLVNPMNIVESRIVPSGKMMVTPETRARLSPYILEIGDIVIARRGELGRCAIVSEKENGWLCGTGSFFVRLSTKVTRQWFVFLFGSNLYKARLTENSVGTTMNNLNQGILQELVIPVPPLEDQRRLVDEFCELQDELGSLRDRYNRKIVELQRLKTSLLDQAFRGNL